MVKHMRKRFEILSKIATQKKPHNEITKLIGYYLSELSQGQATFELPIVPAHHNGLGVVQGGILAMLADSSMGVAAASLLDDSKSTVTVELKINYIRSVKSGHLRAFGRVIHAGSRLFVAECEILNENDELLAKAMSTLMIIDTNTMR